MFLFRLGMKEQVQRTGTFVRVLNLVPGKEMFINKKMEKKNSSELFIYVDLRFATLGYPVPSANRTNNKFGINLKIFYFTSILESCL